MSAGKVSIFITVISLHACVLGIVYVSTRKPAPADIPGKPVQDNKTGPPKKAGENQPSSVKKNPIVKKNNSTPVNRPAAINTANGKYRIHTVGPNDYLGKIASKYKVSSKSIIKLNDIKDPNRINRGQKLKIPLN